MKPWTEARNDKYMKYHSPEWESIYHKKSLIWEVELHGLGQDCKRTGDTVVLT